MESPNNVMMRDYYLIVLVLGIVTFWKCYLYSYVFIKIISKLFFQTLTILNKWKNSMVTLLAFIMSWILEQNE